MRCLILLGLVFTLSPVYADYVISVNHLKNGNKTVMTDILYFNSMSDCKVSVKALLKRADRHTGGSWFIADEDNSDLVTKAYFFHDEPGVSCVVIPSDKFGNE